MKNKPQLIRISFYLIVLGTYVRTNIPKWYDKCIHEADFFIQLYL